MPNPALVPLSLYLHVPYCIRKCPYCDFNSHAVPQSGLSTGLEAAYFQTLARDVLGQLDWQQTRPIETVFIGGGTPSLFSASGYADLFRQLRDQMPFSRDAEITLEANPGTLEHQPFAAYLAAGINRLSLGVQTLDEAQLTRLGRVHDRQQALQAIRQARQAGFDRLNVDLMHGLPGQTPAQALSDLQQVIDAGATHLSWYQLTIEPNTVFYREQPLLPDDDALADIQAQGESFLRAQGFAQYEVSAWVRPDTDQPCRHNLNYWQFGDYLAAGAGAHGKITQPEGIYRYHKTRLPRDYLAAGQAAPAPCIQLAAIDPDELPFEFMLNALRLTAGVPVHFFNERTGLSLQDIGAILIRLQAQGLLQSAPDQISTTPTGLRYLNSVLQHFLPA